MSGTITPVPLDNLKNCGGDTSYYLSFYNDDYSNVLKSKVRVTNSATNATLSIICKDFRLMQFPRNRQEYDASRNYIFDKKNLTVNGDGFTKSCKLGWT